MRQGQHLVFYVLEDALPTIVGIPHNAMDLPSRLKKDADPQNGRLKLLVSVRPKFCERSPSSSKRTV